MEVSLIKQRHDTAALFFGYGSKNDFFKVLKRLELLLGDNEDHHSRIDTKDTI